MTLDMVNRLLYVFLSVIGIVLFFFHMRFYTETGLKVVKKIIEIVLYAFCLTPVYGLVEYVITGDGKSAYWLFEHGIMFILGGLFYYGLCIVISNADLSGKERAK